MEAKSAPAKKFFAPYIRTGTVPVLMVPYVVRTKAQNRTNLEKTASSEVHDRHTPKTNKANIAINNMLHGWGGPFGIGGGHLMGMGDRFEEQYHCYSMAYADKAHLEVR